jgi:hypothetical protein
MGWIMYIFGAGVLAGLLIGVAIEWLIDWSFVFTWARMRVRPKTEKEFEDSEARTE